MRLLLTLVALATSLLAQSSPAAKNDPSLTRPNSDVNVIPLIQQAELTASDGAANYLFGSSVAVDGGTVVVGSPYATVGPNAAQGAAYVFVQDGSTWRQIAELAASDGRASDYFGMSVAISGGTIAVGAPGHSGAGATYVFAQRGNAWSQQAELTASDGERGDNFGWPVAVSGHTVLVGASAHAVGLNFAQGVAYVFVQSGATWTQQQELTASDGAEDDHFGESVALSAGTAVAGAVGHTVGFNGGQGAAYVFVEVAGTWSQQAELTASDGKAEDEFGGAVAVSGSEAVVGAIDHTVGANEYQGAAYVFVEREGTWSQQAELTSSDGGPYDFFGYSAAVSGGTAVVGAVGHTVGSNVRQGDAYAFAQTGGTWSQQAELTSSDGASGDFFGRSAAVSGSTTVGASGHMVSSNPDQGAAYVFGSASGTITVTLTPTLLSFGNQAVSTSSAAKTVTLSNTGTATLDISSIAITLGNNFAIPSNTCVATLDAGQACEVNVTFTPTELGAATGTLSFTDNAAGSPQAVSLSGTGVAQATLTPATYNFPETKIGETSAAHNFNLRNNLPTTLTGISYSTTGPFSISSTTCGTTLDNQRSCTISVTFSPTQTGTATGTLAVSDSASNSPQTAQLSGTAN